MAAQHREPITGQGFWELIGITGILISFAAPCVFAYRFYRWLKLGNWVPITVKQLLSEVGLSLPTTGWAGVQKILSWVQNLEVEWAILALGILVAIIGAQNQIAHEETARRRNRNHPIESPKG